MSNHINEILFALSDAQVEFVVGGGVVKKKKPELKPSAGFERALALCTPEDFDGHTEFHRLTPEQRLEWLCQAATFVYEFKGKARLPGIPGSTGC